MKRSIRHRRSRVRPSDAAKLFDMSELGGGDPISIAEFLKINEECPPDKSEVAELRAAPVGGTVHLGIGGGFVTVRRTR